MHTQRINEHLLSTTSINMSWFMSQVDSSHDINVITCLIYNCVL